MTEEGVPLTTSLFRRSNPSVGKCPPNFSEVHHPVPEGVKHITSPLSAALFLFGVGTAARVPAIRSWWAARRTLGLWETVGWRYNAKYARRETSIDFKATTVVSATPPQSTTGPTGARNFSTTTGTCSQNIIQPARSTSQEWDADLIALIPGHSRARLQQATRSSCSTRAVTESCAELTCVHPRFVPTTTTTRPPVAWYGYRRGSSRLTTAAIVSTRFPDPRPARFMGTMTTTASLDTSSPPLASASPLQVDVVSPTLLEKLGQMYPSDMVAEVAHHICEWPSVQVMETLLASLQATTGLPWWASIAAMTCALRLTVVPLQISFMRHHLRMKILQPQLISNHEQMKAATTPEEARRWAEETLALLREKKAWPLIAWWTPVLFPPYFLSWFACVHNAALSIPEMQSAGILWFTNLCAADPSFLLPVMASLTWLGIVEMGASAHYATSPRLKMWTRFTALALIPVLSTLPSAVFCFWISSNIWELVRIVVFNLDSVRRRFDIPLRSELPRLVPPAASSGQAQK